MNEKTKKWWSDWGDLVGIAAAIAIILTASIVLGNIAIELTREERQELVNKIFGIPTIIIGLASMVGIFIAAPAIVFRRP